MSDTALYFTLLANEPGPKARMTMLAATVKAVIQASKRVVIHTSFRRTGKTNLSVAGLIINELKERIYREPIHAIPQPPINWSMIDIYEKERRLIKGIDYDVDEEFVRLYGREALELLVSYSVNVSIFDKLKRGGSGGSLVSRYNEHLQSIKKYLPLHYPFAK